MNSPSDQWITCCVTQMWANKRSHKINRKRTVRTYLAVAKMADIVTACVLRTTLVYGVRTYGRPIVAEPNGGKCSVWTLDSWSREHAAHSYSRRGNFGGSDCRHVSWLNVTSYSRNVTEYVNRKCRLRTTTFTTFDPYTDPERNVQRNWCIWYFIQFWLITNSNNIIWM